MTGMYYTPAAVLAAIVAMHSERILDPVCGAGDVLARLAVLR